MVHRTRGAKALVSSKHDERLEAVMMRAIRISETELERVLARQERDHARPGHISPQVDDEVTKVVFFSRSDGAVGQEHERAVARQAAHRVIRIDPRISARGRFQFRTRRPQLGRDDAPAGSQIVDKGLHERDQ